MSPRDKLIARWAAFRAGIGKEPYWPEPQPNDWKYEFTVEEVRLNREDAEAIEARPELPADAPPVTKKPKTTTVDHKLKKIRLKKGKN